jgi:hypothetical protein
VYNDEHTSGCEIRGKPEYGFRLYRYKLPEIENYVLIGRKYTSSNGDV